MNSNHLCDNKIKQLLLKTKSMNEILEPKISTPLSPAQEKTVDLSSSTREKINVLWTGGFDSTYRILQLSKLNVDIQPHYLFDKRKSEKYEINAIKAIKADIEAHPQTKASILPLIRVRVSEIEPDASVTEAYNRLHEKCRIGIQYEWLGRFSKAVPGIEIVVEKGDSSKFYNCVMKNARLVTIENKLTSYSIVDRVKSDSDFFKVFGNFRFPQQILKLTKLEIAEKYHELGYGHTIHKTWFCHTPINDEPCGICNPCKSVVEEGLSFRITRSGMRRYRKAQKYGKSKWFNYYIKLYRLAARII